MQSCFSESHGDIFICFWYFFNIISSPPLHTVRRFIAAFLCLRSWGMAGASVICPLLAFGVSPGRDRRHRHPTTTTFPASRGRPKSDVIFRIHTAASPHKNPVPELKPEAKPDRGNEKPEDSVRPNRTSLPRSVNHLLDRIRYSHYIKKHILYFYKNFWV